MTAEIVILGRTDFEPGHRDTWLRHAEDFVVSTRQEPGCQRFVVLADPETDTRVYVQEHYDDAAAFDAHRCSEHAARFRAATAECRVKEGDVAFFEGTRFSPGPRPTSANPPDES